MTTMLRNLTFRILFPGPPAHAKADEVDPEAPPSYQLSSAPTLPSSPIPPPPAHPSRPRRFPWRTFLYHCIALAVSGITLAITAFVVWVFDDNPEQIFHTNIISGWYESITLNSVLAWLSVIAKVTLMVPVAECIGQMRWVLFGAQRRKLSDLDLIDGASRDVFGALGWIFRFRRGLLVHLGAALMIVSLGFDPAIQQLISYELRSVVDVTQTPLLSTNPSYSPTRGFNNGLILATPRALLWGATSSVLGARLTTDYTCSSGNCTFPITTSVGVCHTCEEITSQLERNCTTLTAGTKFCQSGSCFTSGQICKYTFNGTSVGGGNTFFEVVALPANSTPIGSQVSIPANRLALTALYIQPDPSFNDTHNLPVAPGYVAPGSGHVARGFQCGMSYCEQKYQASVVNGTYNETLINTTSVSEWILPIPDITEINDALLSELVAISPTGETNVSLSALYAMSNGLTYSLTGGARVIKDLPAPGSISEFHRSMYINLLSNDFGVVMDSMVESMSAAVRNEGETVQKINGTASVLETYTRAHWAWFAFPATIWVLALTFMLAVVIKTRKDIRGPVGWLGNSQVAGIFIGLDGHVQRDVDTSGVAYTGDSAKVRSFGEELKLRIAPVQIMGAGTTPTRFTKGTDT